MMKAKILTWIATVIAKHSKQPEGTTRQLRYEDASVTIILANNGALHIADRSTGKHWTNDADPDRLSQECLDALQIKYLSILGVSAEHIELCAAAVLKSGQEANALRLARNMIVKHRALTAMPAKLPSRD